MFAMEIREYTVNEIEDVLAFERELRNQEDVWGWEIDEAYIKQVTESFADRSFANAISYLAYEGGQVVGRIDCSLIQSHFDGSTKAYLDWICVLKSNRHKGVAQALMETLRAKLKLRGIDTLIALTASNEEAQRFYRAIPDSKMHDIGIWITIR